MKLHSPLIIFMYLFNFVMRRFSAFALKVLSALLVAVAGSSDSAIFWLVGPRLPQITQGVNIDYLFPDSMVQLVLLVYCACS